MTKQELKAKIDKLENGIKSKATPSNLIAPLKAQKAKFEKELQELETAEKKAVKTKKVSKVAEKIKAAKTSVAKKAPAKAPAKEERKKDNIARDGDRKSLPSGKRISKTGKVYYETRANRSDKQTSKKPYLADGGMITLGEHYKTLGKKDDLVGLKVYDKNNDEFVYIKNVDSGIWAGKNKNDESGHSYRMSDLMVEKMADGGKLPNGKYKYEKDDEGMFQGDEVRVVKYHNGDRTYEYNIIDEDGQVKTHGVAKAEKFENQFRYFPKMDDGGETEEGVDLFEDYENIPTEVQKILDKHSDAFEDGDYRKLEKANNELKKIGYTFEYGLDGEAYDLRKIGQKGKMDEDEYAKGGELKKAQLLIIDPSNPLSTQLKKLTGDFLNSADFKDIGSGNFNILTHKHSNKVFIVYPKRIYDSLPEQEKQDDINYLKNVEKIKLNSDSMADGGYVIFEGRDNYNDKPLYKVISKDEDNDYDGEFHDNREDAEKELNELKNKDMNYAKGGELKKHNVVTSNERYADDLLKYADLQNIPASSKMVGNKFIVTFDAIPKAMDSMTQDVKNLVNKMADGGELKSQNGKNYKEEFEGSNRWLEVDDEYSMTKSEHESEAFRANSRGDYELRDKHREISQKLSEEPIKMADGGYMAKGGKTKTFYELVYVDNDDTKKVVAKFLDKNEAYISANKLMEEKYNFGKTGIYKVTENTTSKFEDGGYMADGGQVPAHFGSGKNIEVFGYETKNFDICGTAVKEFEAAVDIMKDSKELEKESLAYCAKYVDNLFEIEKEVVEGVGADEVNFIDAVSDIMSASTYNFRAGMAVNLYSFVPQHLMEIAVRLAKAEKGGLYALGGMTAGRWYKDASGEEFKFIGKVDSGANKGRFLFSDGQKSVYKDLEEFEGGKPKETKLFGFFAEGGMVEHGLKVGDKIVSDLFWDNTLVVDNSKTGKAVVNLETGKRIEGGKMEKGGYMADGGQIKDQYQGKSPEYLWNNWTEKQREHFNHDHELVAANDFRLKSSFDELPEFMKKAISEHYKMGQYAYGGYMAKGGDVKSLQSDFRNKVKESEDIIDELASHYKQDSESMEALTDALQMLGRSRSKVILYTREEDLKEMAKGGDLNSIKEEYLKNEDENAHSENVVLLAKHFGTKEDLAKAKEILALHEKEGSLSSENGKKRQVLNLKLIGKARAQMAKEGIEFEKGGYMADGGGTKAAKFKVEDMVYSYQNKDYAAPINYVKFSPWDSNSGSHPNDTYKYRLSLKDGHSKWTDEKSLYKTKQKEYADGGMMAKGGETNYTKKWKVVGITMQGKRFEKEITLGRMSDRNDVMNALKRMPDTQIREITFIGERFKAADGGMMAKGGEVAFDNSNLYLNGFGMDSNGNSVVKVSFPNQRAFSIQTNGVLKETNSLYTKKIGELTEAEIKTIEKEVVEYVKQFGSKEQKQRLKTYSGYMAKGGIYSSDSLYILKVSKDGKEVGEERFRAKNAREAREMGEDYEEKYKSKFGGDLSFSVKEAESKMADGGELDSFEKKVKDAMKQTNKWHFITENVDGKDVQLKMFVGTKEVDVQIFKINGIHAKMPRNYSGKRDTLKMIMDNFESKMAMGGKTKFADKVKSVQESLLKRKKVATQVQKDYGKTYNKAEAKESAQRIVGSRMAQLKEKMAKKKK